VAPFEASRRVASRDIGETLALALPVMNLLGWLAVAGVGLLASGCGASGVNRIRDVKTVQNTEATHIWIVLQDPTGNDYLMYCDSGWPGAGHPLCLRYPGASETAPLPQATPPQAAQAPR